MHLPRTPRPVKYGLIVIAVLVLIVRHMTRPNLIIFSSNTSPDGLLVAENFMVDGCVGECATGRIVIRNTSTGKSEDLALPEPMPGIFFRWKNANHLVIFQDELSNASPVAVPDELAGIKIARSTYPNLSATAAKAKAKWAAKRAVLARDVSATYSSRVNPNYSNNGTTCELKIVGKDAQEFQEVGIDVIANTGTCSHTKLKGMNCGAMDSRFWVSGQRSTPDRWVLTSADVRGADGYGILPTGKDHQAIRGQFLDSSASRVVRALSNTSIVVSYNFDFVERNLEYELPTSEISSQIEKFQECIKHTDFEWLKHIQ